MTILDRLEMVDFRAFHHAVVEPAPDGATVLTGPNGAGKTTVLEAVAYLGTQRSFRGAPREAMVRGGCDRAVVRGTLHAGDRRVLVETEVTPTGRQRAQVNRRPVHSRTALTDAVPITVFCPGDLTLVQGGPGERRELLDGALRALDRRAGRLVDEVERILRQRGALLRQVAGELGPGSEDTLDVWDSRLAGAGSELSAAREALAGELGPLVGASYERLAAGDGTTARRGEERVAVVYRRSWEGDLGAALAASRREDLRRAVTSVGPHRDELELSLGGRSARLQASQGEQRCLALALRLAAHRLVTERTGAPPVLLLDDVFSELDPARSRALVAELPAQQALVTTAVPLPPGVAVAGALDVRKLGCPSGNGAR
jgi:DNA replication and repair protein RecF